MILSPFSLCRIHMHIVKHKWDELELKKFNEIVTNKCGNARNKLAKN